MTKRARVLVVDDEETICTSFQILLADRGFDVAMALSIDEAKNILAEKTFDVAVIDNTFPEGQEGVMLIEYIKSIQPSCQTILMSGYHVSDLSAVKGMNICETLFKPVKQHELCNAVERVLGGPEKVTGKLQSKKT